MTAARRFSQRHRHLLGLAGLAAADLEAVLDHAAALHPFAEPAVRKLDRLRGRTVINLFFENSTRTRTSFEIAAKRLSADAINISAASSSTTKGETLIDTARNLVAMGPDAIVIRHAYAGAAEQIARHVDCAVINAGDGQHEHPTQGLLDLATIRRHKGRIAGLEVAIVGDLAHSRVARSGLLGLTTLGANVRLCAPWTLVPAGLTEIGGEVSRARSRIEPRLEAALEGADVVMMLRVQNERTAGEAPRFSNTRELSRQYGLSARTLAFAKPDAIVMHPGPINRGVELAPDVADSGRSVILDQVSWGVAVRMAVLDLLVAEAPVLGRPPGPALTALASVRP
ncbi:MAG: aspartate carbamoyltransferase catalytic subunit [Kofleriaceae bacterium]|nr:aspartate carbamoyltransferase catalytic subunit [Kofleriaceae bacterium]MBP6838660.1 aspartate carbamoyltransferase catalytic subunit [Kofleriaceae bacterium]MBP9204320.1 aspartate carbamoyltransferase catalytic subunit [Kofleriaceae bacterium]